MSEGPTHESLTQSLLDWLSLVTGIPSDRCRRVNSGGMSPRKPYLVLTPIQPLIVPHRAERRTGAGGSQSTVVHGRGTYQVDIWAHGPEDEEWQQGPGLHAADYALRMVAGVELPAGRDRIEGSGLSVIRCDSMLQSDAIRETAAEERGTVEVEVGFRWQSEDDFSAGWIERIVGQVAVDSEQATVDTAE